MPSSPSTRDRLELQAAGENLNTWGAPKLNAVVQRLEEAKDGRFAKTLSGAYTLVASNYVADEARMAFLDFSGVAATVTVPAVEKTYLVRNATSGDLVITTGSGTSLTLHTGTTAVVAIDGTNVRSIGADADDLAATLAAAKAYTDAASIAAGSLPAATGLADYFLATGPTGGGASGVPAWTSATAAVSKMGLGTASMQATSFFAQAANNLSDLSNATTARTNLGLGSAATRNTGTSGAVVPLLDGSNSASGPWTFSAGITGSLTGNVTGNVNGNVSGSSASCTGNALTATTATTANAVAAGSVAPAGLSTGHPSWDSSGDFFPFNADTTFNFTKDPGNGMHRLYYEANSFIEFNTSNHRIIFVIGGTTVGYVDPAFGFVNAV